MNTKTAQEMAAERFDREASYIELHRGEGYATCIREEVEPLEAENAKLRALVQELVDSAERTRSKAAWYANNGARQQLEVDHALCVEVLDEAEIALHTANVHGFVPTNTTEG